MQKWNTADSRCDRSLADGQGQAPGIQQSVWQRQIKYSYVPGSLYKLLGAGNSLILYNHTFFEKSCTLSIYFVKIKLCDAIPTIFYREQENRHEQ